MSLGRSQLLSNYTMTDHLGNESDLQRSIAERDLGIVIDCSLNFSEHIHKATYKAHSIMAVIRRSFTTHLDCQCFTLLFKSLVRPHLEYGVPNYKLPIKLRILKKSRKSRDQLQNKLHPCVDYHEKRLSKLSLPTLRYRRHRGDMIEVYKILHGIYDRTTLCSEKNTHSRFLLYPHGEYLDLYKIFRECLR